MYRNQFKPTISLRLTATAKQKHHRTSIYFGMWKRLCVRDSRQSILLLLLLLLLCVSFRFVCASCMCI